jgi:hypothetical protein
LAAIAVSGIAPTLALRTRGFEERRETVAGGTFLTREHLTKRDHSRLSDVLRSVRGARLMRLTDGSIVLASSRGPRNLGKEACFYQVILDGVKVYAPGVPNAQPPDVEAFSVMGIEAIELYAGPAVTPPVFSGLGAACGTIVIWTRTS